MSLELPWKFAGGGMEAHKINSHEINSHEINSHEINSHEVNSHQILPLIVQGSGHL